MGYNSYLSCVLPLWDNLLLFNLICNYLPESDLLLHILHDSIHVHASRQAAVQAAFAAFVLGGVVDETAAKWVVFALKRDKIFI